MTTDKQAKSNDMLRQYAEEKLKARPAVIPKVLSIDEAKLLLHELQVHQIELEMQNEDLREAQAALDTLRAHYFDLYDLAPVGYCTISEQGLIQEANLTAESLLCVPREALLKQPISRFIFKDDQDIYYLHRRKLFETREPQVCDLRMLRQGETPFWIHLEARVVQNEGNTPICHIVISDISERKKNEEQKAHVLDALQRSEARYLGIIEDQTELICRYLPDGRLSFVNEAYVRYFGKKRQDILNHNYIPEIPRSDMDMIQEHLKGITPDAPVSRFEHRVIMPDGTLRWQHWTHRGIYSPTAELIEYQAVGRDITERKLAEQKIQAALRDKETLLRELSHRTKNNMNVISSLITLQATSIKNPQSVTMLKELQGRILAMSLVHEKLYKSDSLSDVDMGEYISDLANAILEGSNAADDKVSIKLDIAPLTLSADDAIPCGLIINELMANSLKYAFPGERSGEIQISLHRSDGDELLFRYSDNGVGFPDGYDPATSKSLGVKLIHLLATKQLMGKMELLRGNGCGILLRFKPHELADLVSV